MTETRDEYLKVYLSQDEKSSVVEKAEEKGMSASTLGRSKILELVQGESA